MMRRNSGRKWRIGRGSEVATQASTMNKEENNEDHGGIDGGRI